MLVALLVPLGLSILFCIHACKGSDRAPSRASL